MVTNLALGTVATALLVCLTGMAGAQTPPAATPPPGVETSRVRCGRPGLTHSRTLASLDRARQAWAEIDVTRSGNRCRLRWLLHASANAGTTFDELIIAEAPPLSESNDFHFAVIAFTNTGDRVLTVRNESLGDWTSRSLAVYDFGTRAVLTQDVNARVERLAPDDCPVHGYPLGFASDDTVALEVVSAEDVDDDAFRCWPRTRWELDMRTGELRRLAAGARIMSSGVALERPTGQ